MFLLIAALQSVTGSWAVSIAITSSLVSVVAAILGARELDKRRKAARTGKEPLLDGQDQGGA